MNRSIASAVGDQWETSELDGRYWLIPGGDEQ